MPNYLTLKNMLLTNFTFSELKLQSLDLSICLFHILGYVPSPQQASSLDVDTYLAELID